jgi:V8-like Glu-specific endopeptidase
MIRYERQTADDQRWGQGTGWLIQPDVLVTAGHCVYDHSNGLGRAVEIKVWLGYNGKDSIGSKDVQFRQGKSIATTKEWVASDLDRARDVGFVQVSQPFEKVVPFDYKPLQQVADSIMIGVVGYPADKTAANEKGAQMYEEYKRTNYDLRYTDFNMLEYEVSTYKGIHAASYDPDALVLTLCRTIRITRYHAGQQHICRCSCLWTG